MSSVFSLYGFRVGFCSFGVDMPDLTQNGAVPCEITYSQAREIVLAMIRMAFFDLESSESLRKNEARDWLLREGIPLAEEVRADICLVKMQDFILMTENEDLSQRKIRRFRRNAYENRSYE